MIVKCQIHIYLLIFTSCTVNLERHIENSVDTFSNSSKCILKMIKEYPQRASRSRTNQHLNTQIIAYLEDHPTIDVRIYKIRSVGSRWSSIPHCVAIWTVMSSMCGPLEQNASDNGSLRCYTEQCVPLNAGVTTQLASDLPTLN